MRRERVVFCAAGAAVLAGQAHADIYTSRAAFDAAVAGLTPAWSEDFEGFAVGPAPMTLGIGGWSAEIVVGIDGAQIIDGTPLLTGNGWIGPSMGGETIQGSGGSSLGLSAIGFDYFSEFEGMYEFHTSTGVESAPMTGSLTPLFVGWIGDPGQTLDFVDYDPGSSAHIVDNFDAYIPAPGTAALLGLGGLMSMRRRR